jgi:two-component system phosphate regulon sensor histidine kinase PhoR
VTLRDITEQATALQLKTDFVANASHELRTPLASIKTAAETLADLGDESPAMRSRLVSMIASNAARLEELSRDLLDLSSLESVETKSAMDRIDVLEIARDLHDLFETACAERRIALEFDLDDRLRSVWTDGRLLRLVLRNLIDNAIKFAYEDTAVRVRGVVVNAGPAERDAARFEVIDLGIGIPLAQQQRVFERFFQVDAARSGSPRRRGTGLGLAIVKHALRAIGGTIQVKSVWQQGTTMTVVLPGCVDAEPLSA